MLIKLVTVVGAMILALLVFVVTMTVTEGSLLLSILASGLCAFSLGIATARDWNS